MATRMLQRRGTAAEWAAANPILGDGEIGYSTDAKVIKVGDGVTAWVSLVSISVDKARDSELLDGVDSTYYLQKGGSRAVGRNTQVLSNLNQALDSGWYDGSNMTGAPDTVWFLVLVLAHSNNTAWVRQIAYSMTGEQTTQTIYSRRCNGNDPTLAGNWTGWVRIDGADSVRSTIVDAKGDLIAGSAPDAMVRVPVGIDGRVLMADSTQASGVTWSLPPSGGVGFAEIFLHGGS